MKLLVPFYYCGFQRMFEGKSVRSYPQKYRDEYFMGRVFLVAFLNYCNKFTEMFELAEDFEPAAPSMIDELTEALKVRIK